MFVWTPRYRQNCVCLLVSKTTWQLLQTKGGVEILNQWVVGTEKNLVRIFKDAELEQAILLIDEIDEIDVFL